MDIDTHLDEVLGIIEKPQKEITKIELLDVLTRHLKILYLQNNIIEKMVDGRM